MFNINGLPSSPYVRYEFNAKNSISYLITGANLVGEFVTHIYYPLTEKKLKIRRQERANNRVVITDLAYL